MSPPVSLLNCATDHSFSTGGLSARRRPVLDEQKHVDAVVLELREHFEEDRHTVEQFIRGRFDETFGARVYAFMPRLFSLRNAEGFICGALGLRSAIRPLFLEHYLDSPIELEITARAGTACARHAVAEVGHLSGTYAGAVRTMIEMLTRRLYAEGIQWVAFAGTASLRNAFHRMGLSPIDIAPARRERLPQSERSAWGAYYDSAPRVYVGDVQQGHRMLCRGERANLALTGCTR